MPNNVSIMSFCFIFFFNKSNLIIELLEMFELKTFDEVVEKRTFR